jgi:hypothetical protein
MNLEYIGEHIFLQELKAVGQVWLIKGGSQNIHALELDENGFSLPVWSQRTRAEEYLKNARLLRSDYEPFAVPVEVFIDSWLSDQSMGISELLINLDGSSAQALVLTIQEFKESQHYKQAG